MGSFPTRLVRSVSLRCSVCCITQRYVVLKRFHTANLGGSQPQQIRNQNKMCSKQHPQESKKMLCHQEPQFFLGVLIVSCWDVLGGDFMNIYEPDRLSTYQL